MKRNQLVLNPLKQAVCMNIFYTNNHKFQKHLKDNNSGRNTNIFVVK